MRRTYVYKPYPAYRYKKDHEPVVVHDKVEDEVKLNDGWVKTPKDEVKKQLSDNNIHVVDEEVVDKIVDGVALASNLLLRVPKSRSKKDLRDIASLLEIELPKNCTLKQMKEIILSKSQVADVDIKEGA